ncbi:MAG: quinate 5-dehydrogenase [Clostridiales bacterium]|jgi:hypothetical protein|nr:quinate 5-dehydrogenase [Eubacteriales bacterium]MDH7564922.1 quinate 5-dehydrogenase [Clostridiales bacterium]
MKRVVSVSIGSDTRNKRVESYILGEKFRIERIGTNGDINKAIEWIKNLDGKVDAFGMGGIDLFLTCGTRKRYVLKEAVPIMKAARISPIVDGTGVKNTLEGRIVNYLKNNKLVEFEGKKVLVTSAMDRYKMTEAFVQGGCDVLIGDLIFALGIPVPIRRLETLRKLAGLTMPLISRMPFKMLYPTGEKQLQANPDRFGKFYEECDIIAGDYHYIKKYMPENLKNKTIVTNTITEDDVAVLKSKGASLLVTTTPQWEGRSFGTNVIEAILVSLARKKPEELSESDYYRMLDELDFKPRIEQLN